jgi:hypothetical protein
MDEEEPFPARVRLQRGGVDFVKHGAALAAAVAPGVFARVAQRRFERRPQRRARTAGAFSAHLAEFDHHEGAALKHAVGRAAHGNERALAGENGAGRGGRDGRARHALDACDGDCGDGWIEGAARIGAGRHEFAFDVGVVGRAGA